MAKKGKYLCCCLFLMSMIGAGWLQAVAQENRTVPQKNVEQMKKSQKAPQELVKSDKVPVMVIYNNKGMDSLGRRLVFTMRERFNKSDLFRLSGYDEQKIRIVIRSQEEFEGRPGLSSVYSIVWNFSYGKDVLSSYLSSRVGFVAHDAIQDQAESLVARTDEIFTQYSYLFEEE